MVQEDLKIVDEIPNEANKRPDEKKVPLVDRYIRWLYRSAEIDARLDKDPRLRALVDRFAKSRDGGFDHSVLSWAVPAA